MDLIQVKQTVESNLAAGKFVLNELDLTSGSIPQFLSELPAELQFSAENTSISLEGDTLLRLRNSTTANWNIQGISAGLLQQMVVDLMLRQDEAKVEPDINVSGLFNIPGFQKAMSVTGTLSHSDSGMIDFRVSPQDGVPDFREVTNLTGIQGLEDELAQLNITLPAVNTVWFGFNIQKDGITYIGVDGSVFLGNSSMDVECMFSPDLLILGKIPAGERIHFSDLLTSLSLNPASFPQLDIETLDFSLNPTSQAYSFEITLNGDWNIAVGNTQITLAKISTELNYSEKKFSAAVSGEIAMDGTALSLEAKLTEDGNWEFCGKQNEDSVVKLRSLINLFLPDSFDLPDCVPDMGCKGMTLSFTPGTGDLSFSAYSSEPWVIPIGVDGLSITDIQLTVERTKGKTDEGLVKGHICGTLNIGTVAFTTLYNFPGDVVLSGKIPAFQLSPLMQDICGGDALRSISLPPGVFDIELQEIAYSIAVDEGEMTLSAGCDFGKTDIQVKRDENKDWGFTVAFDPPDEWNFSAISPSLSVLDSLDFADTVLILASGEDDSFELSTISIPGSVAIKPGLNLFATLNLAGLGVDELLNIEKLTVYTLIGSDLRSLVLEAQVKGEFYLAKNVAFCDLKFCLNVAPANFAVSLKGCIRALMDRCELNFKGALGIQATPPTFKASMQATMEGCWQDPFGTRGLAITDVAIDLGVAFPPFAPAIGFTGILRIGTFEGAAAFKIDPTNPRSNMVAIAFNELSLPDIYDAFCPPEVKSIIPENIAKTVLDIGFEKVKVYIVPQATTIGEISFEQGISLAGIMHLWGLTVSALVKIDQDEGLLIQGAIDPIDIGGVFKLTGNQDPSSGASLYLDLRKGAAPEIQIDGAVQLLGIQSATTLRIADEEFYFFTYGKIYDLFEAAIEVRGKDIRKGDEIQIKAAMRNDLFAYLREQASLQIEAFANSATSQISSAQKSISDTQAAIAGLQKEIEEAKARIYQLNCEINDKQRWYDNSPWWEKCWKWAELSAYATIRYAEIGTLYAKIGALEAAKHIAFGTLEAAKWALEGIKVVVGAAADVGQFITNFGLGGLIDIREARFEGTLSAAAGGRVSMEVHLTFMNQMQYFALDFDFQDPMSAVKQLAHNLLPALPA